MTLTVGITGGAGYIGSKLTGQLLDDGIAVRVIDNFSSSSRDTLSGLDVDVIEGSILDKEDMALFLDGVDFVYDLAGVASVPECERRPLESFEVNAYARYVVLEAIRENPIRGYVFASSVGAIYGDPDYLPVDEDHPVKTHNVYGISKRTSELFIAAYHRKWGLPLTIVRQSNIFGDSPGLRFDSVVHIFLQRALSGDKLTLYGSGDQVRNFIHIDDLLRGYRALIDAPESSGKVLNLASTDFTISELAQTIIDITKELTGIEVGIEFAPEEHRSQSRDLKVSIERARDLIGFEPRIDLRSGLELTADYIYKILSQVESR
tara:strand:+ start:1746 stop:2705 length:960 start_codon:yes stop_codon:yes gene_type:complete